MKDEFFANHPVRLAVATFATGIGLMGVGLWLLCDPQAYQKKQNMYFRPLTLPVIRFMGAVSFLTGLFLVYGVWFGPIF